MAKIGWDQSFLDLFKRPAWAWQCDVCLTWMTKKDLFKCLSCEGVRKGFEAQAQEADKNNGSSNQKCLMSFGGADSGQQNLTFGNADAGSGSTETGFTFGSTSSAPSSSSVPTFTFGDTGSTVAPAAESGGFTFGTTANSEPAKGNCASDNTETVFSFDGSSTPASKAQEFTFGNFVAKEPDATIHTKVLFSPQLRRTRRGKVVSASCGKLYTWGSGDCDQLGHGKVPDGEEMVAKVPTAVDCHLSGYDDSICAVSCGGLHNAALAADGTVLTWGCNDDDTLGREIPSPHDIIRNLYERCLSGKERQRKIGKIDAVLEKYKGHLDNLYLRLKKIYGHYPGADGIPGVVVVNTKTRFVEVQCGDCHTAALSADGRVFTWGTYKDSNGYIGFNKFSTRKQKKQARPMEVPTLRRNNGRMTQIACGSHHTCARSEDGLLFAWGDAEHGQLGLMVPSRLKKQGLAVHTVGFRDLGLKKKDRRVVQVFCHLYCSFAVLSNGKTYAWGLNNYGQLGLGDKAEHRRPTPTLEGLSVAQVDGGLHHSMALTADGHVYTFGRGDSGQLGIPSASVLRGGNSTPQRVETFASEPAQRIACGANHCLVLTHSGDLYSWGFGEMYQLGHDADKDEELPRKIRTVAGKVLSLSCGGQHSAMVCKPKVERKKTALALDMSLKKAQ